MNHLHSILRKGKVIEKRLNLEDNTNPYELRGYQEEIVRNHLDSEHLMVVLPTGSGKSLIMMTYAAQRYKQQLNTVILVPKLGIATGFEKYVSNHDFKVKLSGDDEIKWGLPNIPSRYLQPGDDKIAQIAKDLEGDSRLIVCSYNAFIEAWKLLSDNAKRKLAIILDEGHHSSVDDTGTRIGQVVKEACSFNIPVHIYTATDYRSDGGRLIPQDTKFDVYRRTLIEHYKQGFCPDFGFYFKFYDKVSERVYEKLSNLDSSDREVRIGSVEKLLRAYIREYKEHRIPTLMVVPQTVRSWPSEKKFRKSAAIAKELHNRLLKKFPGLRILNLGSLDGETYESEKSNIRAQYQRLATDKFDVVISIRVVDEGVDWPDCAQVFFPRIPSSIGLIMQRLGRSLRFKIGDHLSPNHSRIVFFELVLLQTDKFKVCPTLYKLAVRLKALCYGLDWVEKFSFNLPKNIMAKIKEEKDNIDGNSKYIVDQKIYDLKERGASLSQLVEAMQNEYRNMGIEISATAALELLKENELINSDMIQLNSALSNFYARSNNLVNYPASFADFLKDPMLQKALEQVKLNGICEYVSVLSDKDVLLSDVRSAINNYVSSSFYDMYESISKFISLTVIKNVDELKNSGVPLQKLIEIFKKEISSKGMIGKISEQDMIKIMQDEYRKKKGVELSMNMIQEMFVVDNDLVLEEV